MEMEMTYRTYSAVSRGLVIAMAFGAGSAMANTLPAARVAEMMGLEAMDTDKDGMVSREEFLAAAAKSFDMAAQHMGAKQNKLTSVQLREFRSAIGSGR
jgi:hypothetical protein